jgi:hypothetical protein
MADNGRVTSFMIYHNPGRNIDALQVLVEIAGREQPVKVGRVGHAERTETFELQPGEAITHISGIATKRYSFVKKRFVDKPSKDRLPTGTDQRNFQSFVPLYKKSQEQIFCSLRDFFNPLSVASQFASMKASAENPTLDVVFSVVVKALQIHTSRGRNSPVYGMQWDLNSVSDSHFIVQLNQHQEIANCLYADDVDEDSGVLNESTEQCRLLSTTSSSLLHFLGSKFPNCGCINFVLERCHNCASHQSTTHHIEEKYVQAQHMVLDEVYASLPMHAIDFHLMPNPRIGSFELYFCSPDGRMVLFFSKKKARRFPKPGEIEAGVQNLICMNDQERMHVEPPAPRREYQRTAFNCTPVPSRPQSAKGRTTRKDPPQRQRPWSAGGHKENTDHERLMAKLYSWHDDVNQSRLDEPIYDRLYSDSKKQDIKRDELQRKFWGESLSRPGSAGSRGGGSRPTSAERRTPGRPTSAGRNRSPPKWELVDVPEDRSPSPPGRPVF